MLIKYRRNRENWSKASENETEELTLQAGKLRTTLLQHMDKDGLHHMGNSKGLIDDTEQLEELAEWNYSDFGKFEGVTGSEVKTDLTRAEADGIENHRTDTHSSAEPEDTRFIGGSPHDNRSVETTLSQDATQSKPVLSALASLLGFTRSWIWGYKTTSIALRFVHARLLKLTTWSQNLSLS